MADVAIGRMNTAVRGRSRLFGQNHDAGPSAAVLIDRSGAWTRTLTLWGPAILVVAVLIVGVWFRFCRLDQKVYADDEVYTSLRIAGYTRAELAAERGPLDADGWQSYQRVTADRGLRRVFRALLDDMHPPLYFLGAYWWARWFDSSVWVLRCFSVVISLLVFPCLYWLCRELFESRTIVWIAVALVAVSPFHVLYAQEARPYSLWTLTILLSGVALLRALRVGSVTAWALYGVTVAMGVYVHYLAVFLIPGHGLYAWIVSGRRARRPLMGFTAAIGLAALAVTPWLVVAERSPGAVFIRRAIPASVFLQRWLMNVSSVFFDPQVRRPGILFDAYGRDVGLRWNELSTLVIVLVVVLVGYSLWRLCREAPSRVSLFVLMLIGVCVVFLVGPDLVKGGQRSTTARYLIPAYLGIELAVANVLAVRIGSAAGSASHRWLWRSAMAALFGAGVVSCTLISRAETSWTKYQTYYQAEVARIINRAAVPLVLVNGPIPLLGLSHFVRRDVTLQLAGRSFEPPPDRFSDTFVYDPPPALLASLAGQVQYRPQSIHAPAKLWRLERIAPGR